MASGSGQSSTVKILIKAGADVNAAAFVSKTLLITLHHIVLYLLFRIK